MHFYQSFCLVCFFWLFLFLIYSTVFSTRSLSNDNDYTTAKNYIWMHDWVNKNNQYSQTCTPSNSGQSPASCTSDSSDNTYSVIRKVKRIKE